MTTLRILAERCGSICYQPSFHARLFSTSNVQFYKLKNRIHSFKKRQRRMGTSLLVKTPDWSHLDGRPAPPGTRATLRKEIQRQICHRIIELNADLEEAEMCAERKKLKEESKGK